MGCFFEAGVAGPAALPGWSGAELPVDFARHGTQPAEGPPPAAGPSRWIPGAPGWSARKLPADSARCRMQARSPRPPPEEPLQNRPDKQVRKSPLGWLTPKENAKKKLPPTPLIAKVVRIPRPQDPVPIVSDEPCGARVISLRRFCRLAGRSQLISKLCSVSAPNRRFRRTLTFT